MKNKSIKDYCPKCNKITLINIIKKEEVGDVKGQEIHSESNVPVCTICGEEVFIEKYEEKNLDNAYNVYREKNNILFVDEIKAIREQYGISQSDMAKALGWGAKTITRYENGDIPNRSHNELFILIKRPFNFRDIFNQNKLSLNDSERKRIESAINAQCDSEREMKIGILSCFLNTPHIFNGNQPFDYNKLFNVVLYFTKSIDELFKTKLNKFLFYADFSSFKKQEQSITGLEYVHLPYGPVPNKYDIIIGLMIEDHILYEIEIEYPSGALGTYFKTKKKPNMKIFNDNEKKILKKVVKIMKNKSSKEISDLSHQEDGYLNTKTGELISYEYAKTIKLL